MQITEQNATPAPAPGPGFESLVALLRLRAAQTPERTLYTFLAEGEEETGNLSFGELDRRARAIAAGLQEDLPRGARALLLYPPGFDFIAAFFGCLYAGVVATPVNPPEPRRLAHYLSRLRAVVEDAAPAVALTTSGFLAAGREAASQSPGLSGIRWEATDAVDAGRAAAWRDPGVGANDIALLQYTSGSTSTPKGVMVSHGNLLYNCAYMQANVEEGADDVQVSWLPVFHDMGLIQGLLVPVLAGCRLILMPPAAFLQQPFRWLQALSRYRGTLTGVPNFALDLAVRKTSPEQRATLDLSSVRVIYNASEPARPETIERFVETFAPCGLRREASLVFYGLAEATLLVSGCGVGGRPQRYVTLDKRELERHRIVAVPAASPGSVKIPGCGPATLATGVVIADPERRTRCAPDEVGEIWVSGPTVAQGYWNRPEETEATLRARLADTGEGPFLRTGDLGFVQDGELYVTGRIKDLIILRGANHYPQDIELTVERSHPRLRPGCGAAFAVEEDGEERLAVVQEVSREAQPGEADAIFAAIRQAVAREHGLEIQTIVLLPPSSIAKTSSGKIQRRACRAALLSGKLEPVAAWRRPRPAEPAAGPAPTAPPDAASAVAGWLAGRLAAQLGVEPGAIDPRQPFAGYGVGSLAAVSLAGELAEWLGRRLPATLLYEHPTIESLARHLTAPATPASPAGAAGVESAAPARPVSGEAVAVVGIGCRFPGASGPRELWRLLAEGVDAVGELPAGRAGDAPGLRSQRGGYLSEVDRFDAAFFGLTPSEAERMDPQQRILLEVAWEALEDAGLAPDALAGTAAGVFVGLSNIDYARLLPREAWLSDPFSATGLAASIAANRISYLLDLRGPSVALDTACSSSLVAVHLACESLRNGDASLALAGGANLILAAETSAPFTNAGLLSAGGSCRAFDAGSDGYVRGEGVGIVVLKPLSRALAEGDRIYAVLRGSAVNQDGRSNGLTAPNPQAQEAVLREAYRRAGVSPGRAQYVEAHGSGTPLGDPIEAAALGAVLADGRAAGSRCALGTVKTNLGHLEAAAGIAGLIKVALALERGEIPPSLHFERPNPRIAFGELPLAVQRTRGPWLRDGGPPVAGVSSFGFGGTNAHAVLEAPPAAAPSGPSRPFHLLALSARTAAALEAATAGLRRALEEEEGESLADVAYTLQTGRQAFDHRRILVARDREDALAALSAAPPVRLLDHLRTPGERPVAFLFPGLGDHYPQMGRGLYESEPTFRREIDRCCELLEPRLGVDLRRLLYPGEATVGEEAGGEAAGAGPDLRRMLGRGGADQAAAGLGRTLFAQPALFAVEYALARLWMEWGIRPRALLGYSLGEYVAACLAGVLELEDALALVAERARLIEELPAGAMLAVPLPAEALGPSLAAGLSLAAVNGPSLCVIAGPPGAVAALAAKLEAEGVTTARLAAAHAFHSGMLAPVAERLGDLLRSFPLKPPSVPLLSNLTGGWLTAEQATDPGYWVAHTLGTVRFAAGLEELAKEPGLLLLEVGPGSLTSFAKQHPALSGERGQLAVPSLRAAYERQPDEAFLLSTLGRLWLAGVAVDWAGFHAHGRRARVSLPTYPFERRRHWLPLELPAAAAPRPAADLPKRLDPASWLYVPGWSRRPLPPAGEEPGPWLVLAERSGPGARIAERLRAAGREVSWAAPGSGFACLGDGSYTLDPRRRQDYEALLDHLGSHGRSPVRVIHLWTVTRGDREPSLAGLEEAGALGFDSLLALAQALGRGGEHAAELVVVTSDLHEVTGEERVRPEKALVVGPATVLPQEMPGLRCRLVDVVLPAEGSGEERELLDGLIAELALAAAAAAVMPPVVALRRGHRWVRTFEPLPAAAVETRLRPGGVYLITGGLGGLGLGLAEHLARTVGAKLVLTGRTALPPRESWGEALAAGGDADQGRKIRSLLAIEELGGEVMTASADVTDLEAMRSVVAAATARFGALHGVLHAAGVPGGGLIELKDPAAAAAVLAPKTRGTLVLDEVCRGLRLDFMVLFSSLVSVAGGAGQVDYCAANAFLEAFAQRRFSRHGATVAVAWGEWQWDAWEAAARGLDPAARAALRERRSRVGISFAEGAEALDRILGQPHPQVLVSPQELPALLDLARAAGAAPRALPAADAALPESRRHPRPVLGTPYAAPSGPVEAKVAEIWQAALGLAEVGSRDDFFALGGTSLHATQVISRVRQSFAAELTARTLFEAPVLADFARRVEAASRPEGETAAGPLLAPVGRGGPLPVSFAQRRLWFLDQLEPGDPAYNVPFFQRIAGELDAAVLERSLAVILERHEVLRTTFRAVEGEPVQVIGPPGPLPVAVCDLSGLPADRRDGEVRRLAAEEAARPFDLERDLMLRSRLLRLGEREHVALFTLHHIAGDAWSAAVTMDELSRLYDAFRQGVAPALPALPVQYADFAVWQRRWLTGEVLERKLAYWRRRLAGAPPDLALPADRPRPAVPSGRGGRHAFRVPAALAGELRRLSRREGGTLFMVLAAALGALLHRLCGAADLVIGTEVANRDRVEIESLIGFFVNILLLRFEVAGTASFQSLLRQVREAALGAYAHQDLPFDKLVEDLAPERRRRLVPLAQVMLVLQNIPGSRRAPAGLELTPLPLAAETAKFDLLLIFEETPEDLLGVWHYSADLFDASTLEGMSERLLALLESVAAQPEVRLRDLDVSTLRERERKVMESSDRRESKLKSFLNVRPKAISVSQGDLVRTRQLAADPKLPLVVEPAVAAFDLVEWTRSNRDWIERRLLDHGALLFRGANGGSIEEFERFASALCGELFAEYGDLPREDLGGRVYTSTPYPPDQAILFHNESSQLHAWPLKQLFLCVQPAEQGGETPIADCRRIYRLLDPGIRRRFEELGLLYVRNFVPELDVHWTEFFRTDDRAEVEERCRRAGMTCEWYDGSLRTSIRCRAVARHPKTGEISFFNQIQAHHISCLDPAVRDSLCALFPEERLPRNVYFGDGSPIADSIVEEVRGVYDQAAVSFPWERGDILLLDNMLTAHARNPYAGARKIVVSMGEMVSNADLDATGWPAAVEGVAR
jgi:acyl transferase domain-containing protein/acyl-CoA synthetase (AMP-forming)/AMP-acid ligase II/acyl carrier protein/alpha-ketoglutarate-dependent taurine dioxygenase